jgi:thiamine-phosphate pyrophosphorylase
MRESYEILRILDANANRAAEGLRVVEEYLRFVLEDGHLTVLCNQLLHYIFLALAEIPSLDLL